MDKFDSRNKSNSWLKKELIEEAKIINVGFEQINICVSLFESLGSDNENKQLGRLFTIGAITLAKACHLMLGCYSLTLDGLSKEAGALFRPLIEVYELLVYLRDDPNRIEEVMKENLPSAGERAKQISGKFQDLRKYFSDHASHFSYKVGSISHLVNYQKDAVIYGYPAHSISTFKRNLNTINAFQTILIGEIAYWLELTTKDVNDILIELESYCNCSVDIFSE